MRQAIQALHLTPEVNDYVELEFAASASVFNNSIVALKLNSIPGVNADSSSSAVCVVLNWLFTFKFS